MTSIALEGVFARATDGRSPASLRNVSFTWDRGVLAIVGTPADGTSALLGVIAGSVRARSGRVAVLGGSPTAARSRIAHVAHDASLPEALRVSEVLDLAAQIRGEPAKSASARLGILGLERLAERRVRSLSLGEVRAVALAIALSGTASVVLIDEPLAALDPTAPARVAEALRARASEGVAIVIATASVRDATRLADQLGVLTQGVFAHLPPSLAHAGPSGARLRIVVASNAASRASTFIAALAADPAITSIETAMFSVAGTRPSVASGATRTQTVVVTGGDLLAVARAIGVAAASTRSPIDAIESAVMPLDAIRATLAGPRQGLLSAPPAPAASAPPPAGSSPPPTGPVAPPGSPA